MYHFDFFVILGGCLSIGVEGACESRSFSSRTGVYFFDEWDESDTLTGDVCIPASVKVA